MTIAERLKQLRKENNMTLEHVGNAVGLTRATIYRYETGDIQNIPPDNVHRLAEFFGVTRPYLMGWTDERRADPDRNLDLVASKLREDEKDKVSWKPAKAHDCITAATQALRALNKFKIARTPIYPQQIIQASSIASMITFKDSEETGNDSCYCFLKHAEMKRKDGSLHHLFVVDRNLPIGEMSLSIAPEIGHIYLGHDCDRMDEAKNLEAKCFAIHLLFQRPVIKLLQEHGYYFTKSSFSRIFGYCDWCIDSILNASAVRVSGELNQIVKEQFAPYINLLDEIGQLRKRKIDEAYDELDLSKYMAGYEE